jgi:hypothetical protein
MAIAYRTRVLIRQSQFLFGARTSVVLFPLLALVWLLIASTPSLLTSA